MMVKYLFLILCLILCACDTQAPSGYCTPPTVSQSELQFGFQGGVDSVQINSDFWWFASYGFLENGCDEYRGSISDYCSGDSCFGETVRVECPWFELQKIDAYTISVSVNQNTTQKERDFQISLSAGNCGTGFVITQSAE